MEVLKVINILTNKELYKIIRKADKNEVETRRIEKLRKLKK
jgi:hypothetical protein